MQQRGRFAQNSASQLRTSSGCDRATHYHHLLMPDGSPITPLIVCVCVVGRQKVQKTDLLLLSFRNGAA